jgi:hypothetical protein
MIVEVNVFVMPRHFDQFGGLTGSVVEYVSTRLSHLSRVQLLEDACYLSEC